MSGLTPEERKQLNLEEHQEAMSSLPDATKSAVPQGFRRCRVCERVLPLDSSTFHLDSYDEEGFQKACKPCRAAEGKQAEGARATAIVRRLDEVMMSRLNGMADRGGSNIPPAKLVYEELMRVFGGPAGFASHFAANFASAGAGSAIREKMLRGMLNLSVKLSESGQTDVPLKDLSDEQLLGKFREHALRIVREEEDGQSAAAS